jgi:hypothetical protein
MRTIGRRLFSKAVVGAPTALAIRSGPPGPSIGDSSGGLAFGGVPTIAGEASGGLGAALRDRIYKALWASQREEGPARDRRNVRRYLMGGLDPDLSVLNSVALQHRIGRQIEREEREQERAKSIRARIVRALGGKLEDFE